MQNLGLLVCLIALAREIPSSDPGALLCMRCGYVVAQAVILGVYYYVSMTIKRKNDRKALKFVEVQNFQSSSSPQVITTTIRDYDLNETSKLLRAVYMGIALMAVVHLYFKYNRPLFIMAIISLKNLYDANIVAIHVFGRKAEGKLKRPFNSSGLTRAASASRKNETAVADAKKRAKAQDE